MSCSINLSAIIHYGNSEKHIFFSSVVPNVLWFIIRLLNRPAPP